jgi:hypothetical protein
VLKCAGAGTRWTSEWVDLLAGWYDHPDPVVREEALTVRMR